MKLLNDREETDFDSSNHFADFEAAQTRISTSIISLLELLLPNTAYCALASTHFAAAADISRRYLKTRKLSSSNLVEPSYSEGNSSIFTKTSNHRAIEEAYVWVVRGKSFIAMGMTHYRF